MPLNRLSLLGTLAALMIIGCPATTPTDTPEGSQATLTLDWHPSPPTVGTAHAVIGIRDADGAPLSGGAIEIEGTMTHPGMVPVFANATEHAPGRYEADIRLTMRGDWILLVDAKWPNGLHLRHRFELAGVGTSGGAGDKQ